MNLKEYLTKAMAFPAEIHLESHSGCNARCIMCPRGGMTRYQGEMPSDIFQKAVVECKDYHMEYIHFHLNGEPLLMDIDKLVSRIKYTKEINPDKKLVFFTNGSLLDKQKIVKILESGLDIIVISIDGGNAEDYEKIRVGLKFDIVVENVRNLVKIRNAGSVNMKIQTAIVPQQANKKSLDAYHKLFQDMGVDDVGGSGVQNIGGLIDSDSKIIKESQYMAGDINVPCWRIFLDLSIMADGRAVVCCQDVRGTVVIGDLKYQTLKEIWHGKPMMDIRKAFIEGKKKELSYCGECDYMRSAGIDAAWWKSGEEFKNTYDEVCEELGIN